MMRCGIGTSVELDAGARLDLAPRSRAHVFYIRNACQPQNEAPMPEFRYLSVTSSHMYRLSCLPCCYKLEGDTRYNCVVSTGSGPHHTYASFNQIVISSALELSSRHPPYIHVERNTNTPISCVARIGARTSDKLPQQRSQHIQCSLLCELLCPPLR